MAQLGKLMMSSSPHISDNATARRIMLDVIIALIPATLAGIFFFGFYSFIIVLLCVGSCVLFEYLYSLIFKKRKSTGDLSAAVTGLLLALNLPPLVPVYVPVIGSLFAIVIVKMLFGGIGKNFANPAITARIFLLLSFGSVMTFYIAPLDYSGGFLTQFFKDIQLGTFFPKFFGGTSDAVAYATPLVTGKAPLLALFLGEVGGCIGETSAIALLLGGIYLSIRKVIDFRLPLTLILSFAAMSFIFSGNLNSVLYQVLSGGLMLGAIFMATDYATNPNTFRGMIVYAVFIGVFTAIIREFSSMPEGMSFAILLGNLITPLIDKYIFPKHFGKGEKANA